MNSDLNILFNCRKTLLELLRDRQYIVPDVYDCSKIAEFRQLHQAKKIDIFIKEPRKCYVKFVILNKTRPQIIREYIEEIRKNYIGEDGNIIIILKNKPHISLFKVSKEFRNIQFFWLDELINNITKHRLNPKFSKLNENEIEEILKKYNLRSRYNLPLMLSSDPVSKYFNFKPGDICKIERNSPTNGIDISYRCVK